MQERREPQPPIPARCLMYALQALDVQLVELCVRGAGTCSAFSLPAHRSGDGRHRGFSFASDARNTWLQVDVRNATDRLNVINFSGLFSGVALAPGRQVTLQLKAAF